MKARGSLRWVALIALTLLYLAPILWMVLTAFKTEEESAASPPTLLPSQWSTEALDTIFSSSAQTPVLRWFLNSVIAALGTGAVVLLTAAPAAYALARMEFRGKRLVFGAIVATLFVPPIIFLAPNYEIVEALGWLDSLPAVIFPVAAGAFGVFFLRQFFLGMPMELEEAALLDGASRFQVFWRIVLPLSRPALATLFLLSVLTNWNDFLWPLYVLFNPEHLTLSPGLGLLQGANQTNYALLMAGGLVASVPVLLLFSVAQRYIIEGVSRSGLKG
jgi:multiple sugar transport system permease protein